MIEGYVGLGSNQNFPQMQVLKAISEINQIPHTKVLGFSSLYQTKPWGVLEQDDFINAVVKIGSFLLVEDFFDALMAIEKTHKRERTIQNGPRTLDLDLLLYGQQTLMNEKITLPHPGLLKRSTVLVPLAEVSQDLCFEGKPISYYLRFCDKSDIKRKIQVTTNPCLRSTLRRCVENECESVTNTITLRSGDKQ